MDWANLLWNLPGMAINKNKILPSPSQGSCSHFPKPRAALRLPGATILRASSAPVSAAMHALFEPLSLHELSPDMHVHPDRLPPHGFSPEMLARFEGLASHGFSPEMQAHPEPLPRRGSGTVAGGKREARRPRSTNGTGRALKGPREIKFISS